MNKRLLVFIFLFPILLMSQKACNVYGKIKFVEYGVDYKLRFVKYGEDFKVKEVEYGEGCY